MRAIFVDLERCVGCRSCELYCAVEHSSSKSLFSAISEHPCPVGRIKVESTGSAPFPIQCRHCEEAPCIDTCPTGAMCRDSLSGLVQFEEDRCIGCLMCAVVCPFGALASQKESRIIQKCDLCPDQEMPVCVSSCPTGALLFDDLNEIMKQKRKRVLDLKILAV